MDKLVCHETNMEWATPSYKEGIFTMAILVERVFVSFSDIFKLKSSKS